MSEALDLERQRQLFGPPLSFVLTITSEPVNGCASFTLEWVEHEGWGVWRPQPSLHDGKPVGLRRGQCYRASVEENVKRLKARGHTVTVVWRIET